MIYLACENIRFSSLFAAGDETSPAAKSEEKQMFSQAMIYCILQILKIVSIVRIFEFFSTVYFRRANLNNEINFQTLMFGLSVVINLFSKLNKLFLIVHLSTSLI